MTEWDWLQIPVSSDPVTTPLSANPPTPGPSQELLSVQVHLDLNTEAKGESKTCLDKDKAETKQREREREKEKGGASGGQRQVSGNDPLDQKQMFLATIPKHPVLVVTHHSRAL